MPRSPAVRPFALLIGVGLLGFLGPTLLPAAASVSGRYESDVTRFGNGERARYDLVRVVSSACLNEFAQRQAQSMVDKNEVYHQNLQVVLTQCKLSEVGENVGFGYPSGATVTRAWMRSAPHRTNLLNKTHRWIGVGASRDAQGRWYVSQLLGRTR